ncbi:yjeF-related family protein, partial [Escherichia coli FRIK1999]
GQSGRH